MSLAAEHLLCNLASASRLLASSTTLVGPPATLWVPRTSSAQLGRPEGSKNSMPEVRGSFAGTEIRRSSRWHERFAGHFE